MLDFWGVGMVLVCVVFGLLVCCLCLMRDDCALWVCFVGVCLRGVVCSLFR